MTDELQTLARAFRAYTRAPPGQARVTMERLIDDLTNMILAGRTFGDPPDLHRNPTHRT